MHDCTRRIHPIHPITADKPVASDDTLCAASRCGEAVPRIKLASRLHVLDKDLVMQPVLLALCDFEAVDESGRLAARWPWATVFCNAPAWLNMT